jgi:hypothetical protein
MNQQIATVEFEDAYDTAVVAVLNAIPSVTPEQAEHMVEAIVDLVLATFQNELNEELQNDTVDRH